MGLDVVMRANSSQQRTFMRSTNRRNPALEWVRGLRSPAPSFRDNLLFSPTRIPGVEMTHIKKTMEFTRSIADRVFSQARATWNICRPRTKLAVAGVLLITVAISVFTAALLFPSQIWANKGDEISTFTVDVAESIVNYQQNDVEPSQGQDVFSPGDTFILQGTIYPGGTLPRGKANNDPNAPGGIGKYRVRGVFTADFANFEKAVDGLPGASPEVGLVTEIYSFDGDGTSILTDGIWPNANFSARRIVLGGTGQFRDVVGEINEENIGENNTGFCNLRITFLVKKFTR